jgi:hypothetical protein
MTDNTWEIVICGNPQTLCVPKSRQSLRRLHEAFKADGSEVNNASVFAAALGLAWVGRSAWPSLESCGHNIVAYGDRVLEHLENNGALYAEVAAVGAEAFVRLVKALPRLDRVEELAKN